MSSQSSCVSRAQCSGKLQLNSMCTPGIWLLWIWRLREWGLYGAQLSYNSLHCTWWGVNSTSLNWSVFKRIQRYSKILARIKTAKNCWRKFENSADEINLRQLHTMRKLSHLTLTVWQICSCNFPSCQVDQHQHQLKHQNTNTSSNIKSGPTPTPTQKYH